MGMMHIDPVPHTSDFMKGVINLRGKIIPVIDLRTKFKMSQAAPTNETCIIVVDFGNAYTGIIVDFLIGVTRIEEVSFEETPQMSANIRAEFISGMAKLEDRVVIVLELKNVLSAKAMVNIPRLRKPLQPRTIPHTL